MTQVKPVWSKAQVAALNAWQTRSDVHPFTCGGDRMDAAHVAYQEEHGGDFGQLIAEPIGWRCPVCGYRQYWAHDFMMDPPIEPGSLDRTYPRQGLSKGMVMLLLAVICWAIGALLVVAFMRGAQVLADFMGGRG